jgi:hypothetical protein
MMRAYGIIGVICLLVVSFLLFIQGNPLIGEAQESQCFKCHTSAKFLITITREIAKTRPVIKSENEGEG